MTTNDAIQLKPCPFCGGAAEMHELTLPKAGPQGEFYVDCENRWTTCPVYLDLKNRHMLRSPQAAAAVWNKRACWQPTPGDCAGCGV